MKKPSEVFNSIRFAKLDPKHDKGHKGGSQDDEEHYAVGEKEWNQQVAHAKKRAMQEAKEKTEYDYEGDMAKMAADPKTQEWWDVCGPLQRPVNDRADGEWWASIPEVFHVD